MRHVAPEEIWIPDVMLYHSPYHPEPVDALVFGDGSALWVPKVRKRARRVSQMIHA